MLDIGWQELFFISVVALIVIGPKDLPRALATISRGIRKVRGLAREFQDGINDVVREAELEDLKKTMQGTGKEVRDKVKGMVDADGKLTADFDPAEFNRTIMDNLDQAPLRSPRSPLDSATPTEDATDASALEPPAVARTEPRDTDRPPTDDTGTVGPEHAPAHSPRKASS